MSDVRWNLLTIFADRSRPETINASASLITLQFGS
jgi:hypothetical protein